MSDHFTIIYKILSTLEENMDTGQPIDTVLFNHDTLGISRERFTAYLEMLSDSGYIKGVVIKEYLRNTVLDYTRMKITLKGLEYLADNSLMAKAYKASKGIIESAGAVAGLIK